MNNSLNNTKDHLTSNVAFLPWNHPANVLSYEAYLTAVYYYTTVVKPVIVGVGVPANIVNCIVFKHQGLKDRMNLCLFVLALVDMIYLAYSITISLAFWIQIVEPVLGEEIYVKTLYYAHGVNYGFRDASAWVSVVIAVERCVCVVLPLQANTLMSTRTMGILLATIVIGMQLAFITTPLKKYVYPVYDATTGGTRWKVTTSAAWQNSEALLLYEKVEDTFILIAFPLFIFIFVSGATTITVVKLRAAISWREKSSAVSSDSQVQQVALTKMLVLVSSVFIACKVPWVILTVARFIYPEFSPSGSQYNLFRVSELAAQFFVYSHSAVNFFIYYSRSSRFKSHLRLLCGCSRKQTDDLHKTTVVSEVNKVK